MDVWTFPDLFLTFRLHRWHRITTALLFDGHSSLERYFIMRLILIFLVMFYSGCAGQPVESAEERRLQAKEYRERFIFFRDECWQRGKRIYIEAKDRPPAAGIPRPGDRYRCI